MRSGRRAAVIKCIKRNENKSFQRVCGRSDERERGITVPIASVPTYAPSVKLKCFVNILVWLPEKKLIGTTPQHGPSSRRSELLKNCRKEDLRIVALELGETVAEKVTIVERERELTEIIKENKYFKEDVEFVKELIQVTIEDRKNTEEERKKAEDTRLREK
ncbi:hypothetical protein TNCV_3804141 [Trichonephila clavipes]|nr:hypothetical protein TNCV_3804141 [Trichonephila clavipes]